MWISYRTNPSISSLNAPEVAERVAEFPFIVSFAYTLDETNWMADYLLPEATDLESLQLIRIGSTKFIEQFWNQQGWAVRQPVVDPVVDARDMTDIATELARRTGLLAPYNQAINRGGAGMRLATDEFDYSLDDAKLHFSEEIWDAVARAASHDLSGGEQVVGIDWFREHGFLLKPYPEMEWFLYPTLKAQGLRFELPYQERIKRHGAELVHRLHEMGIEWWDRQLQEYEPLPTYEPFPEIWINIRARGGARPGRVPVLGPHLPQHAVFVGRERRDPPHQRGRRQRRRAPGRAHEPRRRARARDQGRGSVEHRIGGRRDAREGGAPGGGAAGHGGHDRAVRPLGDPVCEGSRSSRASTR